MTTHKLKTWPEYFRAVIARPHKRKTVEIRKDDRDYAVWDLLLLQEYEPTTEAYTGRAATVQVTHCLRGLPWVPDGYVAMSIRLIDKGKR